MDRQYIDSHQVVERYVQGALTADEEQAFEEAYLADPRLFEEVQLVEQLGRGLKELDAAGGLETKTRRSGWASLLASPQYAAAASVLLAVALVSSGALYRENVSLRQGEGMRPVVVPVLTVRSDAAVTIPAFSTDETPILALDPALAYDDYRAVVARRAGDGREEIWRQDGLVPGYDGMLLLGVPRRLLTPGDYEIELEGRMREWPGERGYEAISRTSLRIAARD